VVVPIGAVNRSSLLWGEDADVFSPERWLVQAEAAGKGDEDNAEGKKGRGKEEVSGYRHLLTFVDGPRTCLGKAFALAEFKVIVHPIPLPRVSGRIPSNHSLTHLKIRPSSLFSSGTIRSNYRVVLTPRLKSIVGSWLDRR